MSRDSNAPRLLALGCLPCVACARIPVLDAHTVPGWPALWCPGCCDIDDHGDGAGSFAHGATVARAVARWNEQQRDDLRGCELAITPCRCGRAPRVSFLPGDEWHIVCSGFCDGVYSAGPALAAVADAWAAMQSGPDLRIGAAVAS